MPNFVVFRSLGCPLIPFFFLAAWQPGAALGSRACQVREVSTSEDLSRAPQG